MPGATKGKKCKKLHKNDDERTLQSLKQELKLCSKGHSSLSKKKVAKHLSEGNVSVSLKRHKIVSKAIVCKDKASKKRPSSGLKRKTSKADTEENEKTDVRDAKRMRKNNRKNKGGNNVELDEASRLQRRTKYLLIKINLEQNFIDAYSAEGWQGQSREKIKPEKELQRAKNQIVKYKIGIREAVHQLDLLSSEGRIHDSAFAADGSVHHEHIVCAKCQLREAFPDNDIILCDGTCNRAFHQKCMDPPLSTENIPPGDEGWFCKFCKKKMEILDITNAHLGTHFPLDCNWQDVFKKEANLPEDGNAIMCPEEAWPSDDSEDDDYDPDRIKSSDSESQPNASECSSSFMVSLEDESGIVLERRIGSSNNSLDVGRADSDDGEVISRPRQRVAVDYIKLYNEMFGRNATENEEFSEDEDWGPQKKRRKVKETDAACTLMALGDTEEKKSEEVLSEMKENELSKMAKKPTFRLPHNAVEKLRLVFAENELPGRSLRVSLSKQLGLEFEKVNKWFKNARYLALKARKRGTMDSPDLKQTEKLREDASSSIQKEHISETANGDHPHQMASKNDMVSDSSKDLTEFVRRRKNCSPANAFKIKQQKKQSLKKADSNQTTKDVGDDVNPTHLTDKAKQANKKSSCISKDGPPEAEIQMERLCEIKSRIEKLQQVVLQFPSKRFGKSNANKLNDPPVIFVPVAELREKR
ncbi:pathogenesis-related homeodomain protein [Striga asiatica]|uniref:Pathogenesis-related homeodomain protein n=1 Tax=Striga asiatica TaxID=4170 RepID=A0A5A7P2K2_STRAF|nr:pathogenesis-related homeodomain protein [Striga asiatica]